MNPVLYDFKRGLLRISVLVSLVVFTLAGVGLAYLIVSFLAQIPQVRIACYSVIESSTGKFKLEVHVFSPELAPVDGEVKYTVECLGAGEVRILDEGSLKTSNGKLVVEKNLERSVPVDYTCLLYLNVSTPLGYARKPGISYTQLQLESGNFYVVTWVDMYSLPFHIEWFENLGEPDQPPERRGLAGLVSATIFTFQGTDKSVIIVSLYSPLVDEFKLYSGFPSPKTLEIIDMFGTGQLKPRELEKYFNFIGKVGNGIHSIEVNTSTIVMETSTAFTPPLILLLAENESRVYYAVLSPELEVVIPGFTRTQIINAAIQVGPGLFTMFFPVLVLYLVYVYIAKPRAQGALEFILARPITRADLYTTRYTAGVLVVFASVVLFVTALLIAVQYITGFELTLDLYSLFLLYIAVVAPLLAFYSLCFMMSTLVSGTRYIVITVLLYVIYAFIWNVIVYIIVSQTTGFTAEFSKEITRVSYTLAYFNPIELSRFYYFYLEQHLLSGIETPEYEVIKDLANPWLVVSATIAWITLPIILGWLRFRRVSLSA